MFQIKKKGTMSTAGPEIIAGSVAAASATGFSATTVFLSLLIPAVVLYYIYFRISRRHMIELGEKLPGPPALPIIGNALDLVGSSDSKLNGSHFGLNTLKNCVTY